MKNAKIKLKRKFVKRKSKSFLSLWMSLLRSLFLSNSMRHSLLGIFPYINFLWYEHLINSIYSAFRLKCFLICVKLLYQVSNFYIILSIVKRINFSNFNGKYLKEKEIYSLVLYLWLKLSFENLSSKYIYRDL